MSSWMPRLKGRGGPVYLAIVDALADDLARGRLRPGERMPPQRALASTLGINFTTVSRAYAEAHRRGLVVGRVGRGTYVREGAAPAARTRAAAAAGPLRFADLSSNFPPEPEGLALDATLAETLRALGGGRDALGRVLSYQDHQGIADHRAAGAAWIAQRGVEADPARVLVCGGAQHATAVLLGTLRAGGEVVLTEGLTYSGLKALAQYLDVRLAGVAVDEHGLRPDALAAACRAHRPAALYTVPTLQNPTASVMPERRRREIAAVAREHGLRFVEDDIYGTYAPDAPPPLTTFAPELGYYVSSLSKSVAPGLRIAYVLAPDEREVARLTSANRATVWMVAPLMSEIAARWVRDGTATRTAQERRREAAARIRILRAALGARLPAAQAAPSSALHAWLPLPDGWRTAEFVAYARQRGVAVSPGDAFAVDPSFAQQAVRVCVGSAASRVELAEAARTLAALLDEHPDASALML